MNVILLLSAYLFCVGLVVAISRKSAIMVLIGIELMLNASNLNFIYFSQGAENLYDGQLYALFVMVLAAAEAAIGLAIIIQMFRRFGSVSLDRLNEINKP